MLMNYGRNWSKIHKNSLPTQTEEGIKERAFLALEQELKDERSSTFEIKVQEPLTSSSESME